MKRQHRGWRPVGPDTWRELTVEDVMVEQECPAQVKTGSDPDPDEMMSAGIMFQPCGGGRRIIRKQLGGS